MSNIIPFSFESMQVRAAKHADGTPWFVAGDLASVLGYDQTANGLKHCKHASNLDELNRINNLAPATKWIPESDVYRMILRSNTPNAEAFQDWVVEEVLPAIRKTGSYTLHTPPPAPPLPRTPTKTEYWFLQRRFAASHYNTLMEKVEEIVRADPRFSHFDENAIKHIATSAKQAEANLLNRLVLGMTSAQFRRFFMPIPKAWEPRQPIRECMPPQILAALQYLEILDAGLIVGVSDPQQRRTVLNEFLMREFPAVVEYRDRQVATIEQHDDYEASKLLPDNPNDIEDLFEHNLFTQMSGLLPAPNRIQ